MRVGRTAAVTAVLASLLACSSHTSEAPVTEVVEVETVDAVPVIDEDADNAVRAMCDALIDAKQFSFRSDSTHDEVLENDQTVEYSATARVIVRRPDGLFVDRQSEKGHRVFRFDGRSRNVALFDVGKNLYAQGTAPPTVDETLDALHDLFNVTVPLADLAVDDPYDALNTAVRTATYIGLHDVHGAKCHHVAYSNDTLDWQIWIQATGDPVPRKVQITYKNEPGEPRFCAFLDDWNLKDTTAASEFEFKAPAGSRRITMLQREKADAEGGTR